jgi:hypothetical protein
MGILAFLKTTPALPVPSLMETFVFLSKDAQTDKFGT